MGLEVVKYYGRRVRSRSGDSMEVEGTVRFGGAGDLVEIAWEEAMAGERGWRFVGNF